MHNDKLKTAVYFIGRFAQILSLGLTIGGILVMGPTVAPTVFQNIPEPTAVKLMSLLFAKFNVFLQILLVLFVLGTISRFATQGNKASARKQIVSLLLSFLYVGVSFYSIFAVTPNVVNMAQHGARRADKAFAQQHNLSRSLMMTQSGLATVILIILI